MSLPKWQQLIDSLGPLADSEPGAKHTTYRLAREYNGWARLNGASRVTVTELETALKRHTTLESGWLSSSWVWSLTREGLECRNWHT